MVRVQGSGWLARLSRYSAFGGTAVRAAERACAGQPALPVDDAGLEMTGWSVGSRLPP